MNSISPEGNTKFSKAHRERSSLLELLESAPGEKVAVVLPETGIRITYDSLRAQVMSIAHTFAKAGIYPGDRIALALPNGLPAIVCFLAASFVGTAAPLNPGYRYEEFCFYLEDTAARVLVIPPEGGDEARRAAGERIPVLTVEIDSDGLVRLSTPERGHPARHSPRLEPYPEDIALVLHTSGSTGRPKRVPLRHFNLAVSARNIVNTYKLNPDDVSLCVMPLFHVHGLVASVLSTLLSGGTVVVPARFNPLSFWRIVRDHRVTWYSAVPTIHQLLLARTGKGSEKPAGTESLRFIRSCSAPLSPELMQRMEEIFEVPVLEAYGMTEAAHQMASNPLPPGIRKPGTVGRGTGVQIGIMDSTGQLLEPGQPGEVVIQGANVIQGYENNPEANISSFVNRWFRTGDQGVLDGDGYLRLIGRIKELINRGGEKISPREIDEVLLTHPAVTEAVCFGVPHPTWGEEVAAAVVLQQQVSESDLLRYCQDRLADFKCPKKIYLVDSIPRTATGKIQRRAVAEAFSGNQK
ncbi:MAG TPA: acyl--CoA ligase [Candidatus Limnocylindrales bacterium]|nr:acyl--CoA ligase [Candidatus Limnocylindrales bacterium]